jgi:hypothetical protein
MARDVRAEGDGETKLRKLLVPAAAGVAGTAVAVALTKKPKQLGEAVPKVRDAMPKLPEGGIGEITDDLRGRLESVLGRDSVDDEQLGGFEGQTPKAFDKSGFEKRRAQRRKRREQRRETLDEHRGG